MMVFEALAIRLLFYLLLSPHFLREEKAKSNLCSICSSSRMLFVGEIVASVFTCSALAGVVPSPWDTFLMTGHGALILGNGKEFDELSSFLSSPFMVDSLHRWT